MCRAHTYHSARLAAGHKLLRAGLLLLLLSLLLLRLAHFAHCRQLQHHDAPKLDRIDSAHLEAGHELLCAGLLLLLLQLLRLPQALY
jgi:hypothetical protein